MRVILLIKTGTESRGYNLYIAGQEEVEADIRLQNVQSAPRASTEVGVGANLNDAAAAGEKFNVTQSVFDTLGQAHSLAINFMRTEGTGNVGVQYVIRWDQCRHQHREWC